MELLNERRLKVERAAIEDVIEHENGKLIVSDEHAAIVQVDDFYKCVFDGADAFFEYIKKYNIRGDVCAMNMPADFTEKKCIMSGRFKTFAYLKDMPPVPDRDITVKRLAPSLAHTICEKYENPAGYDEKKIEFLMREKGIFGAIVDGCLAGFIGIHEDGNMGMLQVFEKYRRRGIGENLERFLISYIMTFGRVPICDVDETNIPSVALQKKLGLTEAENHTYWLNYERGFDAVNTPPIMR